MEFSACYLQDCFSTSTGLLTLPTEQHIQSYMTKIKVQMSINKASKKSVTRKWDKHDKTIYNRKEKNKISTIACLSVLPNTCFAIYKWSTCFLIRRVLLSWICSRLPVCITEVCKQRSNRIKPLLASREIFYNTIRMPIVKKV